MEWRGVVVRGAVRTMLEVAGSNPASCKTFCQHFAVIRGWFKPFPLFQPCSRLSPRKFFENSADYEMVFFAQSGAMIAVRSVSYRSLAFPGRCRKVPWQCSLFRTDDYHHSSNNDDDRFGIHVFTFLMLKYERNGSRCIALCMGKSSCEN